MSSGHTSVENAAKEKVRTHVYMLKFNVPAEAVPVEEACAMANPEHFVSHRLKEDHQRTETMQVPPSQFTEGKHVLVVPQTHTSNPHRVDVGGKLQTLLVRQYARMCETHTTLSLSKGNTIGYHDNKGEAQNSLKRKDPQQPSAKPTHKIYLPGVEEKGPVVSRPASLPEEQVREPSRREDKFRATGGFREYKLPLIAIHNVNTKPTKPTQHPRELGLRLSLNAKKFFTSGGRGIHRRSSCVVGNKRKTGTQERCLVQCLTEVRRSRITLANPILTKRPTCLPSLIIPDISNLTLHY